MSLLSPPSIVSSPPKTLLPAPEAVADDIRAVPFGYRRHLVADDIVIAVAALDHVARGVVAISEKIGDADFSSDGMGVELIAGDRIVALASIDDIVAADDPD